MTSSDRPTILDLYLKLNSGTEIPREFAMFCGLFAISAALERRVVFYGGPGWNIYPNLYIVLVAGTSRCRKSTAINVARAVLSRVVPPLNLISQKITPEALITCLSQTGAEVHDGVITALEPQSSGAVIADEFVTFLNHNTDKLGLTHLLLNFFDCPSQFKYTTVGRGENLLENVCLGLLGGSTMGLMQREFPQDSVRGGLAARMLFVYRREPSPPVAFPEGEEWRLQLEVEIGKRLSELKSASGRITLSPAAKEYIIPIYNEMHVEVRPTHEEETYIERYHAHWIKLAIARLFSERSDSLVIELDHIRKAQAYLEALRIKLPSLQRTITATETGADIEAIYRAIEKTGAAGIERARLTYYFTNQISPDKFSILLNSLVESDRIEEVHKGVGRVTLRVKGRS